MADESTLDRAPGLTLYLEEAKLNNKSGTLLLRASVNDQATWDAVVERIDGHVIYPEPGLVQVAIDLLREDSKKKDAKLQRAQHEHHAELERLRAENSYLRAQEAEWASEVRSLTTQLQTMNAQLQTMNERVQTESARASYWERYRKDQ